MLSAAHIVALRALMRAGTVRGAAQLLGVAQPGLSRMIRHIEDRLGFALFDRSSGRLIPTQEAHLLAPHVEDIHKGLNELERTAARLRSGDDRVFRLAASPSLGHSLVPGLLATLATHHPGIVFQFDILSVDEVDDYLAFGRGDSTLTLFEMPSPSINSKRIGSAPLVIAAHVDSPLARFERLDRGTIIDAPFVTFREDTPHGRAITRALGEHPRNVRAYVRFGETALTFVAQRIGVALIDAFTARQAHDPSIKIIPIDPTESLPVYLNRNSAGPRSMIGTSFEALAVKAVRRECSVFQSIF